MTGKRGLDANLRGLRIAHLAHHDDIRVGTQKGAHRRREGPADLRVDLYLSQSVLGDFDWILRGPILRSGVLTYPRTECSVVVLPEPVGPQTRNRPCGRAAIS